MKPANLQKLLTGTLTWKLPLLRFAKNWLIGRYNKNIVQEKK